ncbi:hypothetical protein [Yersinia bercovieri]|uniref:hypothetical protein n=1 Tax=Yersinia bercovieri TaxID=634 RepID=UPI0005E00EAB|nr:hypothetical protein [Yersinia bercovieri]CFQ27624.1 Uncharacterised protein [Yersinia bercovieri]
MSLPYTAMQQNALFHSKLIELGPTSRHSFSLPSSCGDPTLPAKQRPILPLIPAFDFPYQH